MKISQLTIQNVQQASDIKEVISEFLVLKKSGAGFSACCPFHNEKTPSFHVNVAKQVYKCFGCGAGGDAIKFVMEHEKMDFRDTILYLAKKYDIPIVQDKMTDEELQEFNKQDSIKIAMEFASEFYQDVLKSTSVTYFVDRGFSEETIRKFKLGYSIDHFKGFKSMHSIMLECGYSLETLMNTGLFNTSESGKVYDFFRERAMFPIQSITGQVIAFGGRVTGNDQPKYLNSSETSIYSKSNALYGIYQAKRAITAADECIIVEGYTDVLSLNQAGIENVVASCGTALTAGQVGIIERYTRNITLIFDGDKAGVKAALKNIDVVLETGLNVYAVILPDDQDPDSSLREIGKEAFLTYVESHKRNIIDLKIFLAGKHFKSDGLKKSSMIRSILSSIISIPDPVSQRIFIKELAEKAELPEHVLILEIRRTRDKR